MPELLAALDAFLQEHRRCGEKDGGVDDYVGECEQIVMYRSGGRR